MLRGEKGEKGDKGEDGTVSFDELTDNQLEMLMPKIEFELDEHGNLYYEIKEGN